MRVPMHRAWSFAALLGAAVLANGCLWWYHERHEEREERHERNERHDDHGERHDDHGAHHERNEHK